MKKFTKFAVLAMALFFVFVSVGCKRGSLEGENVLEVYVWNAGYGAEWMEELLAEFETLDWVKEKYPDLQTEFNTNDEQTYAAGLIPAEGRNTVDLFFASDLRYFAGTEYVIDLTDVLYNSEVPGEGVLYKDKMIPEMYQALAYYPDPFSQEFRHYTTSYSNGMIGLCYNQTLFEGLGLKVPNTTEELFALCEKIKNMEGQNFLYPKTEAIIASKVSYIDRLFPVWWAQYEGSDGYRDFYHGIDEEGIANSVNVFDQQGLIESAEVYDRLFSESSGYFDRSSMTYEFMAGQSRLLTGEGLIMCNGEWFSYEMHDLAQGFIEKGYDYTIGMMRPPVVSSIIDQTPTIKNDAALSAVIDDIDAGKTSPTDTSVSQKDFDRVKQARNIIAAPDAINATGAIPSYALGKEIAVDFLRFMATDRANEIYAMNTGGGLLPFEFELKTNAPDTYNRLMSESKNTFMIQSQVSDYLHADGTDLLYYGNAPLATYGLTPLLAKYAAIDQAFMSDDSLTAEKVIGDTKAYWTDNNNKAWQNLLMKAGLN